MKLNKLLQKKSEIINGNKKIKSGTTLFVFISFVAIAIFDFMLFSLVNLLLICYFYFVSEWKEGRKADR